MNAATEPPLIAAEGLSIAFGGSAALSSVSFDVRRGEIHALCGENGAGKSSLMKILGGIYAADAGTIRVDGVETRLATVDDATRAGIAIIHQELNLVDHLTVVDNIFLGKEITTRFGLPDRRAMRRAACEVLDRLGFKPSADALLGGLRVGEKQLVEIAKALVAEARLLIMDEPTSALSETETQVLLALCRQLRASGIGLVLISHRLQEVFDVADRVTVLRDGRLIATLPVAEVRSAEALVSMMIGKDFQAPVRGAGEGPMAARTLIDVRSLSLRGPGRPIVDSVSFSVVEGQVFGISGLLGAGKTEILEALFGVSPHAMEGEIRIGEHAGGFRRPDQAVDAGLAFVTEDRKKDGLMLDRSIEANLSLPSLSRIAGFPLYRRGAMLPLLAARALRSNIKHRSLEQPVNVLSGGNQQKLIIGKWLMTKPRILLLDEPTRGVDVAAKSEIYSQILDAAREGLTVVVASSEIDELMLLCDRIMVLCEGRMKAILAKPDFSGEALVRLASP